MKMTKPFDPKACTLTQTFTTADGRKVAAEVQVSSDEEDGHSFVWNDDLFEDDADCQKAQEVCASMQAQYLLSHS